MTDNQPATFSPVSRASYAQPLTVKEIAFTLRRSRSWVQSAKSAMQSAGIRWHLGMISLESFLTWVRVNDFRCTEYFKKHEKSKTECIPSRMVAPVAQEKQSKVSRNPETV